MSFFKVNEILLEGFGVTCNLFFLTLLFSLPLGLLVTAGSMSRIPPVRWVFRTFVWIIRGTPLMLQLFVVFYGPGLIMGSIPFRGDDGRFIAALVAFVINYACYFSEIYRGGILSIPHGQYEAGDVLGLTRMQTFFSIVLM